MSVTGHQIEDLQNLLLAALVGQTLTGVGDPPLSVTLEQADDDIDSAVGAKDCRDGGVVVRYIGGAPTGTTLPNSTGTDLQFLYRHAYQVDIGVDVSAIGGQVLASNLTSLMRQAVNLLNAAMAPTSGAVKNYDGTEIRPAARHSRVTGHYVLSFIVRCREAWEQ